MVGAVGKEHAERPVGCTSHSSREIRLAIPEIINTGQDQSITTDVEHPVCVDQQFNAYERQSMANLR